MVIKMSIEDSNKEKLNILLNKYDLGPQEKKEFLSIIYPIFIHDEFQRRMTNEFPHHGEVSLGNHIIEDAIVTYLLSKKYKKKHSGSDFEIILAVQIAMFHDLYTLPWQNNPEASTNKFLNKHGFRHPIEAVINVNSWYPELFNMKKDAEKLIDGIVHHMYPLPVISFVDDGNNSMELKNFNLVKKLSEDNKKILIASSNRNKIGNLSLARSKFPEGRIMSIADKIVSVGQFDNINSVVALLTGKNKRLKDKKSK